MGIQPRKVHSEKEKDEEALLPASDVLNDEDDDDVDGKKRQKGSEPAIFIKISQFGLLLFSALAICYYTFPTGFPFPPSKPDTHLPKFIKEGIEQCRLISRPSPHFEPANKDRTENDRFVKGTKSVWLRNGTIWTGEKDGEEVLGGYDIYLEGGVIRRIEKASRGKRQSLGSKDIEEVDLKGSWVTPGIVDMHSHLGVDAAPALRGSDDTNSLKGSVQPWLRSLDGFDTHDEAFNGSIAGGITTMLVLPGSANAIGGTAYPFKPRWTDENTPQSMLVEPAFEIRNGSWHRTKAWRHIKHACGENPSRVYSQTRLDTAYDFRRAYTEGQTLKEKQERWCEDPKSQTEPFPHSIEWEALADVIRGQTKVNIHCYETVDLTDLVRISHEFKVPIAAFHHAHEAYLVPDLLKSAYGPEPPTVAIFATNARYKKEAYRGTEFAAKILTDNGLNVAFKSDHPVLNSRYLVFEAAQGHYYGLNASKALSSVTTIPAHALGLDHRIGYVRVGYDADLVVWDSHPLTLGATPKQTYIDGIAQILNPHNVEKPSEAQSVPPTGKWDDEAAEAVLTRGDPDLRPKNTIKDVIFVNVKDYLLADWVNPTQEENVSVLVENGKVVCVGVCEVAESTEIEIVDLKGGSVAPGLITVGSALGLREIAQEKSTSDGPAYDPLSEGNELLEGLLVHGVDGASFGGKDVLRAYRSGVTTAITSPLSSSLFSGLSYAFNTGSEHSLQPGAIVNPSAALHISLSNSKTSISTKLAVLRRLLQSSSEEEEASEIVREVKAVKRGERRLVVEVNKADVIAAVVRLKREVAPGARITILGGTESWIVAEDLAKEDIGVIVSPSRSFPADWDNRRIIPGPPLSAHTLPSYLASKGVKVGLGVVEEWEARNARLDAAWVYSNGGFSKSEAIDLVSTNLAELLGLDGGNAGRSGMSGGWVAYEGDFFEMGAKVRAVAAADGETVDLF